jgi:plasmanylethanolamine desaturase
MSHEQSIGSGHEVGQAAVPLAGVGLEPTMGRKATLLEVLAVVGFFVLSALLLVRVVQVSQVGPAVLLGVALVGYVLADLSSGLVHWGFDTWGSPDTPVLGPNFIHHFRTHHDDPKDITRHGFIATNGNNCLATMPLMVFALVLPAGWSGTAPLIVLILSLCLGTFATNQFHKWAHQDQVHPLVGWLQRMHLILPPDHHDVHHRYPYLGHYCITTGWLNVMLDKVGFFRGMERLVSRLTGAVPRQSDLVGKAH